MSKQSGNGVAMLIQDVHDMTLDFRGSKLVVDASKGKDAHGILRWRSCNNVVINDPWVIGTNSPFVWSDPAQYEHAISIEGSNSTFTVNRLKARNMGGDGLYNSAVTGNVTVNQPDIAYVGRNGISPVAGKLTVNGGVIVHVGLHGIDAEPNFVTDANTIDVTVDGTRIETYGDLSVETGVGAIVAGGARGGTKIAVRVRNVSADVLQVYVRETATLEVTNSTSDLASRVAPGFAETVRSRVYWETVPNRTISGNSANMTVVNGHP